MDSAPWSKEVSKRWLWFKYLYKEDNDTEWLGHVVVDIDVILLDRSVVTVG